MPTPAEVATAPPAESLDNLQLATHDGDDVENEPAPEDEPDASTSNSISIIKSSSSISASPPPPSSGDDDDNADDSLPTIDLNSVRGLFNAQRQRGRTLQRRLAGLNGLHQRLSTDQTHLEAAYQTAQDELEAAEETINRLRGLESELEKRYESLITTRQAEIEAEAARRLALSVELKATVEEVQKEQRRVHEEATTLRAQREALAAQVREGMAALDKEAEAKKARDLAAEAEMAGYRGQIEQYDGAFEAMQADLEETRKTLEGYDERIEHAKEVLRASGSASAEQLLQVNGGGAGAGVAGGQGGAKMEEGSGSGSGEGEGDGRGGGEQRQALTAADFAPLNKKIKELELERKRLEACQDRQSKAYFDVRSKEKKIQAEVEEVEAKKHRLEELVAKLEEEDAVLSAKILSAAQSQ